MIAALTRKIRQSRRLCPSSDIDALLELEVESLETRKMLAGNVSVNVSGDNLVIKGDGEGNRIYIYESGGTVWVSGEDTELTGDGEGAGKFDTEIVATELNKLTVKLKGGDDFLRITGDGIEINGIARINTGGGHDDVLLASEAAKAVDFESSGESYGKFLIKTGGGDDDVEVDYWDFYGAMSLMTGSGHDNVYVGDYGDAGFYSKAKVSLGGDDDYLR